MQDNNKASSDSKRLFSAILIIILILNIVLFFLPWFSIDYIGYKNITGINYSGLVDKLESAFVDFSFFDIGIFLYLIPLISGVLIIFILSNSKVKEIATKIGFSCTLVLLIIAYKSIDFLCTMINGSLGYYMYIIDVSVVFWVYIIIQVIALIVIVSRHNTHLQAVKEEYKYKSLIISIITILILISILCIGILIGDLEGILPWFFLDSTLVTYFIRETIIPLGIILTTFGVSIVIFNKNSAQNKSVILLKSNIVCTLIYAVLIYFQGISVMFLLSTLTIIGIWILWLLQLKSKEISQNKEIEG